MRTAIPPLLTSSLGGDQPCFSPGQVVGAVSHELTLDLLALDPAIELLAIPGGHSQGSVRSRISLERAIAPPDPCAAIGNRQPRRSAKGCARSRSGIALSAGASTGEGVAATVVLRGNTDVRPVEGACRIRRRGGRLCVHRHPHREREKDAQQTASAAHVHRIQATTRSGTRILPLVSGPSSSAITKLAAPTQVPTSIGIAKPRP
jgi:hypothetical protein